jgi:hypothetical protein
MRSKANVEGKTHIMTAKARERGTGTSTSKRLGASNTAYSKCKHKAPFNHENPTVFLTAHRATSPTRETVILCILL